MLESILTFGAANPLILLAVVFLAVILLSGAYEHTVSGLCILARGYPPEAGPGEADEPVDFAETEPAPRRFLAQLYRHSTLVTTETFRAYDAQHAETVAMRWWGKLDEDEDGYYFEVKEITDADVADAVAV